MYQFAQSANIEKMGHGNTNVDLQYCRVLQGMVKDRLQPMKPYHLQWVFQGDNWTASAGPIEECPNLPSGLSAVEFNVMHEGPAPFRATIKMSHFYVPGEPPFPPENFPGTPSQSWWSAKGTVSSSGPEAEHDVASKLNALVQLLTNH